MSTSALSASNIISRFVSFFVVVLLTHTLTLHDYGVVNLVLAISGPALSLINLGFDDLVIADVARFRAEGNAGHAKRLLLSYYRMQAILLVMVIGVGVLFRTALVAHYGHELSAEAIALVCYIIVQVARTSTVTILNIHKKFFGMAWMASLEPVIRLCIVGALVYTHLLTPATTIYMYVGASTLVVLSGIPLLVGVIRGYRDVAIYRGALLRETLMRHGKWQGAMTVISSFIGNLKIYLIKFFISVDAVAIYSVAQSMFGAIAALVPLRVVMNPMLAERVTDIPRLKVFVAKASKYTFLIYLALTIGVIAVAPFMIHLFFPKYTAAIIIFELMALRYPMNTFSIVQPSILFALREQRFLTIAEIANAITLTLGSIIFIPLLGLPGTVIESLVTAAVVIIMREYRLRKKYGIATFALKPTFSYDDYDRALLAELVSGLKRKFKK